MLPIVLHHGLFGYAQLQLGQFKISYFHGIDQAIAGRGHPLIVSQVHPTASIARRASQFKQTILQQLAAIGRTDERVIILAHSMGGLDARYMISRLGMADRVAALVTITTPHHGSPYADWCVKNLGKRLGAFRLMKFLKLDVEGVLDLTTESCRRFNDEVLDAPGVRYYSVSCAAPRHCIPPLARHSHRVIFETEGDNDALVSIQSAQWGQHLSTWPADHFLAINHHWMPRRKETRLNIIPHYLTILDHLQNAALQ